MKTILDSVAPDVRVHPLENKTGVDELRRVWELEKSPKAFLRELRTVLRLGGRRISETEFLAPYVTASFPPTDELPSAFAVVIERNAPLYRVQQTTSSVIARLTDDIAEYTPSSSAWVHVRLRDGREGYMRETAVRSPADVHALFRKIGDKWWLVEFSPIAD